MWAKAQIVAFNVDSFPRIVAINLGRKSPMIAGYGDYDCRPPHLLNRFSDPTKPP
jgi:hypothetical protein